MSRPADILFPVEAAKRAQGICPFCDRLVTVGEFRDSIGRREFNISGLCQKCQDEVFKDPVDEDLEEDGEQS